jgi:hypothetical protein
MGLPTPADRCRSTCLLRKTFEGKLDKRRLCRLEEGQSQCSRLLFCKRSSHYSVFQMYRILAVSFLVPEIFADVQTVVVAALTITLQPWKLGKIEGQMRLWLYDRCKCP